MDARNVADRYHLPQLDWADVEARLDAGVSQAPDPPPWHAYRLIPRQATAVATTEPGRATRWLFDNA